MPLLDPALRGRYVKVGADPQIERGWIKVSTIARAQLIDDAGGRRLVLHRTGGRPSVTVRGPKVNRCKVNLTREGVPD